VAGQFRTGAGAGAADVQMCARDGLADGERRRPRLADAGKKRKSQKKRSGKKRSDKKSRRRH